MTGLVNVSVSRTDHTLTVDPDICPGDHRKPGQPWNTAPPLCLAASARGDVAQCPALDFLATDGDGRRRVGRLNHTWTALFVGDRTRRRATVRCLLADPKTFTTGAVP